jgi:hypothetical protein
MFFSIYIGQMSGIKTEHVIQKIKLNGNPESKKLRAV